MLLCEGRVSGASAGCLETGPRQKYSAQEASATREPMGFHNVDLEQMRAVHRCREVDRGQDGNGIRAELLPVSANKERRRRRLLLEQDDVMTVAPAGHTVLYDGGSLIRNHTAQRETKAGAAGHDNTAAATRWNAGRVFKLKAL